MNGMFLVSGEVMGRAGLNTILGIGIVFAMLLLISFIISLFKYINRFTEKAAKNTAPAITASAVAPVEEEDLSDDLELVAVITAAIYAYEAAAGVELPADALRVRSIRRR